MEDYSAVPDTNPSCLPNTDPYRKSEVQLAYDKLTKTATYATIASRYYYAYVYSLNRIDDDAVKETITVVIGFIY